MATNLRFQVRRGTADAWVAANSVLLAGEVALDTTHRKLKVGDGSTAWKDLPFVTPEVVNALLETNGVYDALSAYQGWLLKKDETDINTKITNLEQTIQNSQVKVVNELKATNSGTDALSAAQGWVLKRDIDGKTSVELVNNLTTGGTDKALTAEQGKVLKGLVDGKTSVEVENYLLSYEQGKALSANCGRIIYENVMLLQDQVASINAKGSGTAATIQVGSVTTGEPGTYASVTNIGTASNAILDFTIPRGAKGDTGDTGAQGPRGYKGADGVTPTIKVGSVTSGSTAKVTKASNSTATETYFDFVLPKGDKGDSGTSGYSTEIWTFTLSNGSTTDKKVVLSA